MTALLWIEVIIGPPLLNVYAETVHVGPLMLLCAGDKNRVNAKSMLTRTTKFLEYLFAR